MYSDPCFTVDGPPDVKVGPTADDFADALAAHPLLNSTTPVETTLGGYSGKYVDLQLPADVAKCPFNYYPWAPAFYAQGPNHRWHVWSLDVDGVRVVIQSGDFAGPDAGPGGDARNHPVHPDQAVINRSVSFAVVVVALFAITGCTSRQPSSGGSASPTRLRPASARRAWPRPRRRARPARQPAPPVASIPDGPLAAGTYRIPQWDTACGERQPGCSPSPAHDAVRLTLTVPDGWEGITGTIWLAGKGNGAPDGAGLLVGRGAGC